MKEYQFYREFSAKFLSSEYNQFILTGNIYDIFQFQDKYYHLSDYLIARLCSKRLIIQYNIAEGISFVSRKDKLNFVETMAQHLTFYDTYEERKNWTIKKLAYSRTSAVEGLSLLKEAVAAPFSQPFAFLIEHAETIVPDIEISRMLDHDRQKLVFLRDWLGEETFIKSNHLILMISQTISEIHQSIKHLPSLAHIVIDYPAYEQRNQFLIEQIKQNEQCEKDRIDSHLTVERAADLTAGLNLNGIKHILQYTKYEQKPLSEELILSKTEEVIKGTIGDFIRVKNPCHTFEDVLGLSKIKAELGRQLKIIRLNDQEIIPCGFLVCGRNGVGKTYVMEAFAGQLGWLCLELKNLRQKYLGETDIVFERVKNVLESFKNVMVFIDEADTVFGGRAENVHETEKRLTGNFIKMIGDPKNRGRILWVFITSRPDLLLPDFIRRLEIKIGFFNPSGADRIDFLKNILSQVKIDWDLLSRRIQKRLIKAFKNFSPAEFKMITTQLIAEQKIRQDLKIETILNLLKRFNLNFDRQKYLLQDSLAKKYSTFKDLN